jgi:hypothetical protein
MSYILDMPNRPLSSVLVLAAALLAQGASAQTPARPAQFILPPSPQSQFLQGVAMDGTGNVTFLWTKIFGTPSGFGEEVYARRFSAADVPLGPAVRLEDPRFHANGGTVVANQRGDLLMTWSRSRPSGPSEHILRRTSPVLRTLTLRLKGAADVAVDRDGNFVAVWAASTPGGLRVFGQRYNSDGTTRGPELNAATSTTGSHTSPSVAMNPTTGEFVVVWEVRGEEGAGLGVFGQRFGFTTGRQGSEFPIFVPAASERPSSIQPFAPQVARAANGNFVVIWRHPGGGFPVDVLGQRYDNAGAPVGGQLVIVENESISDSRPQLAMSPAGDFVATWDDQGTSPAWFRLFHRDGTPAGPVISQPGLGGAPYYGTGRVAYGWNGTFVYGWTNFNDEGVVGNTISFQRFAGSPADEPCLFRSGHFRCDTGRTAGELETDHVFAIRGGVPVLGDVDGDGREDYCLFRTNRFDCDSGHNNGGPEASVVFGQTGDAPLLGDVDGDGRADACVFRLDRFLCDTGHDGGAAETEIVFGGPGDQPLLGDVDGDARAEACVYRGNLQFLCDTGHNGGAAETVILFGGPGEIPLLGDYDGDGRDDACTFARGLFRCDTAHDGGSAEATLTVIGPGRPLIGNVDGL